VDELEQDAGGRRAADLDHAVELVDDTRARLTLNVDERLACEALVYRLERVFSRN
jgi:DNA polymerase-3 subunit delta'